MQLSAVRLDSSTIGTAAPQGGRYVNGKPISHRFPGCRTFPRVVPNSIRAVASSAPVAEEQKGNALDRVGSLSQVSGVLGCQWGDEGKGKLVDILAGHFDVVARCQV